MEVRIDPSWKAVLQNEFDKPYFATLTAFVKEEYKKNICYPKGQQIFSAFNHCPLPKVK